VQPGQFVPVGKRFSLGGHRGAKSVAKVENRKTKRKKGLELGRFARGNRQGGQEQSRYFRKRIRFHQFEEILSPVLDSNGRKGQKGQEDVTVVPRATKEKKENDRKWVPVPREIQKEKSW